MIVDLTGFFDKGETTKTIEGEIHKDKVDFPNLEINLGYPIKFNGVLYRASTYAALDLRINFKIKTECDRCLRPLEEDIDTQLFGKLVSSYDERKEEDEELEDPFVLENDRLDLQPYILEQVVASIPMKSLCEDDCKGLCQTCGVDLNIETCDCDNNIIDPRLEKLKELFPEE